MIVTQLASVNDVIALPRGSAVGDRWGGRTFDDSIAAALELRSPSGWLEVEGWTLIVLER